MPAKNTNDFGAVENKIELARVGMAWVGTSDTSLCKVLPIGCLGRMQQSSILVFALIFFFCHLLPNQYIFIPMKKTFYALKSLHNVKNKI